MIMLMKFGVTIQIVQVEGYVDYEGSGYDLDLRPIVMIPISQFNYNLE